MQSKGYGSFGVGSKTYLAHRISWMMKHGRETDMLIMHKCDNPRCVNPGHLREGTDLDNVRDMWRKGRAYYQTWTRN